MKKTKKNKLLRNLAIGAVWSIGSSTGNVSALDTQLDSLDHLLEKGEKRFTDIVEDTEKSIHWHDGAKQTDLAFVYIHGFSASARELSPVTENLAELFGANIYFTRLAGHGRSSDAMAEATTEKWLTDAREAWEIGQLIGKRVVVLSASTGGTLAAWLAAQPFAQSMVANIMVSPNFGIASRVGEIVRWEWGLKLAKWVSGPYREFTPENDLHRQYWTERYPIEALVPMVKLVDQIVDQDHSITTVPHFMVYSPKDQVIRVDRILELAKQMDNAPVELLAFTQSSDPYQHVLAGKACSPNTTGEMVALLENYLLNTL